MLYRDVVCSLLKIQGRPLVRRIKGSFVKLNFKVAFPKEKKPPSFTKGGPFQGRLRETGPWCLKSNYVSWC